MRWSFLSLVSDTSHNTKTMVGLFVLFYLSSNTCTVPAMYFLFTKVNSIHMITLWCRYNYYSHFTDDRVEILSG